MRGGCNVRNTLFTSFLNTFIPQRPRMSSPNKPLSSLSLNLVRQKKAKSKKRLEKHSVKAASKTQPNTTRVRQPYLLLGPCIAHVGESLLPFQHSQVTELEIFELF